MNKYLKGSLNICLYYEISSLLLKTGNHVENFLQQDETVVIKE